VLTATIPQHSRSFLASLIEEGHVVVDGKATSKPSYRVSAGEEIVVTLPPPAQTEIVAQDLPLAIIYDDADLVVIDKPAGLVVHPSAGHADQTLVNALVFHVKDLSGIGGELRPGIVHRLDKETSGVMVIAKNDATHRALKEAWNTEAVRKEYLAIVYGAPKSVRGTIDAPIGRDPRNRKRMSVVAGGRPAITDYEIVETLRHTSLVRCRLRTGRTHQIRVHLKHLGHPIVGDSLYSGPQWRGIPDKRLQKALSSFPRQALHASWLRIPQGEFEAPLPEDMVSLLQALRL
jgi:23S rRNA pseudouridine1911/1915/1917 synthase